jgi:glycosyltransferase involved in cell wall biosynthesis
MRRWNIDVIIPALDEEPSVGKVVSGLPRPPVRHVLVVDNGSRDATARVAREAGATVVRESVRGYGLTMLARHEFQSKSFHRASAAEP